MVEIKLKTVKEQTKERLIKERAIREEEKKLNPKIIIEKKLKLKLEEEQYQKDKAEFIENNKKVI